MNRTKTSKALLNKSCILNIVLVISILGCGQRPPDILTDTILSERQNSKASTLLQQTTVLLRHQPTKRAAQTQQATPSSSYLSQQFPDFQPILSLESGSSSAVVFTPNERLVYDDGKLIKVLDLQTKQIVRSFKHSDSALISLAISPDGNTLVSSGEDKAIKIWHLSTGKLIHTLPTEAVSFAISPNNRLLVSVRRSETALPAGTNKNRVIKLWNLETGKFIRTLYQGLGEPMSVAISPDGQTVVATIFPSLNSDNANTHLDSIQRWNIETGEQLQSLSWRGFANDIAYSLNGENLAITLFECNGGDCYVNGENGIKLWNTKTGNLINSLTECRYCQSITISSDGQNLASRSLDDKLRIWSLKTGKLLSTFSSKAAIYSINFSPTGRFVAVTEKKKVRVFEDLQTSLTVKN